MATVNLSMSSDTTASLASQPYDTEASAEQPWVNTKCESSPLINVIQYLNNDTPYEIRLRSLHDSDIEIRSVDGFVFQLHRGVLGVASGAFPGCEMDTGGEVVQLTEPADVLGILFAFLYPKAHPDLHGESFLTVAAVAEAAGKYEVFSAVAICNERLVMISATLPHFARAPLLSVMEKLPQSYMLPWARYHEAWRSLFKDLTLYVRKLRLTSVRCHSSFGHSASDQICEICVASTKIVITHIEEMDTLASLHDALRLPNTKYLKPLLTCCRHQSGHHYDSMGCEKPTCPFVDDITALCLSKMETIPSFASFLGLKL
ncbi:hypothetical protein GALMADRAFT_230091 [Galerina marginata CBS 339.88]|uniref:BTB domain-containing protein n=1 Tax=Galerina marginata (strain CBS 339.88) TaxID=685588 RepID=A0A067SKF7_GALM3|nr:hypothetical protein GALMADRAFT_230091 [Galerina marginata CBS 339.88]